MHPRGGCIRREDLGNVSGTLGIPLAPAANSVHWSSNEFLCIPRLRKLA